ncbi:MAG: hypothetical protein BGN96_04325 [Bacteroidales bacterium 45-6]|nr:MAG: hypothetical protein BGN96_04325 [Bacteroidales bacterium 45-6]
MDNIVEIARFQNPAEAQILLSLLRAEGIECNLRNEFTSQIMGGYVDVGGAIVEVLEADVPRALDILKEGGYEIYNSNTENARPINWLTSFTNKIPIVKNLSQEVRIIVLLVAVALIATAILFPFITK